MTASAHIAAEEVLDELSAILQSPSFLANRNSSKFLEFIVHETLAGRGSRLKAYTIGTMALQRDPNFDPQTNSVVRVQATRLRELIEAYYAGPGADHPLRILVPLGSYQPVFVRPELTSPAAAPVASADIQSKPNKWLVWPAALLVALGLPLSGVLFWLHGNAAETMPDDTRPPVLSIERPAQDTAADKAAVIVNSLLDSIETGLSMFDNLIIRKSATDPARPESEMFHLTSRNAQLAAGRLSVAFVVENRATKEIVWTHRFQDVDASDETALRQIERTVITEVGDSYGAIANVLLQRVGKTTSPPRGYQCELATFDYFKFRTDARRAVALECLEAEIAADDNDWQAESLLAPVLVRGYLDAAPGTHGAEDMKRASQLARHAFDQEPQRARTQYALFLIRFYNRRFDDAFVAAQKALATNPNSGIIAASIGAAYISRGDFERGQALLEPLKQLSSAAPSAFLPFDALVAYMHGDAPKMRTFSKLAYLDSTPFGKIVKIVYCHAYQDTECVRVTAAALRRDFPQFAADLPGALTRYAFSNEIKSRLLTDLEAAGVLARAQ